MATVGPATPDLRPLRVGEILDVGIKVYTRHAKTLFKLVALVVIPVQVLGVLIIISTIPDALAGANPLDFTPQITPPTLDLGDFLVYLAGILLVVILGFVSTAIATAACFKAVTDAYLGGTPDWKASLRFTMDHLGPLMWVTLLATLGTLGGALLCILPGIWLGIIWSVVTPVLLTEEKRGTKALGRSFGLIQTRFWPACGVIAISYLIETVLSSAIGASVAVVTFTDVGRNVFLSQVLSGTAGAIAAILATPLRAAVIAVLYFDLRVRKEGFDLQLLAQRMGSSDPASAQAVLLPPPVPSMPVYAAGTIPPGGVPPPPQMYVAPPVSGLAIASLISSIVLCIGSIPGVIMGHAALRQIDRSQGARGGRGLAIAGIIVGWIGTAILALVILGLVVSR